MNSDWEPIILKITTVRAPNGILIRLLIFFSRHMAGAILRLHRLYSGRLNTIIGLKKIKAVNNLENVSTIYESNLEKGDGRLFQVHFLLAYAYGALGKDEKSIEHRIAASMLQPIATDKDPISVPIYKITPHLSSKGANNGKRGGSCRGVHGK